jgi:hypothetical protein
VLLGCLKTGKGLWLVIADNLLSSETAATATAGKREYEKRKKERFLLIFLVLYGSLSSSMFFFLVRKGKLASSFTTSCIYFNCFPFSFDDFRSGQ